MHLVDEQAILPVLVVDEAQYLSDRFLADLSGFLNFAFDSRDLFPMWLVGMPALASHLRMQKHAALAMRVAVHVHLEPLERDDFFGLLEHGLDAAGAKSKLLNEPAREMILRASHGLPRVASRLLRTALREAQHRGQDFVDEPDGPRDRGAPVSAPAPLPVARIAELRPPERLASLAPLGELASHGRITGADLTRAHARAWTALIDPLLEEALS